MCVMDLYQPEFLRKPTLADIQNLYAAHNRIHGFPGMLGSIDCMHWEWVNCPKSWHDQYGRGANNDITVLHHSSLFDDLLADNEPVAPYVVNGQPFDKGYFLADWKVPRKMLKGHLVSYKDDGVLLLNGALLGLACCCVLVAFFSSPTVIKKLADMLSSFSA
ncbi:ALP1-like protein isoform X1 [Tanacetum coccineum]|uniref:ALP1-like protein isoform X1 n=1 Tax=Tanacetum coccineum TaxID=301880 RepID=A0ABQ4YRG0_9ASTR